MLGHRRGENVGISPVRREECGKWRWGNHQAERLFEGDPGGCLLIALVQERRACVLAVKV
jgi:hypothetical protein